MTGTQVFDRLALENNASPDHASDADALARLAEQMVAASIASGKMLRELRERMFPASNDPGALAVASALRADFEQWATDAEAVFERAGKLERAGRPIPGSCELGDLIGMTLAMLQITLDDHLRSLEQIRAGGTISLQELRRELQLKAGG